MKQQRENQRQNHVLLVGMAEESHKLVSLLTASECCSCSRREPLELGSLLSREPDSSKSEFSGPNVKFSSPLHRTRLSYLGEDCAVSEVFHSLDAGSAVSVPMTSSDDLAARTVLLRGQNGDAPIDEVLVVRRDLPIEEVFRICLSLTRNGHTVLAASPVFQIIKKSPGALNLNGLPLVRFRPTALRGWRTQLKRVIDVVGALIGAIILLPIFLIVAILIKLTSPGPVFFRQSRIGKEGRAFTFYKFRSMVSGDDSKHKEYLKAFVEDGREAAVDGNGRKVYKITDDPRITPFGHFLRKTSLDEFPQIINVLKGDMSLVGPRPCLPYEWALYEDWQKERLSVTPGLTGLWQVTGRSNVSFRDMVILDLYYISNWSFWWDLKLIFQTLPVILLGKGAH